MTKRAWPHLPPGKGRHRKPTAGLIERLHYIASQLRDCRRVTCTTLAKDLECSIKTIYRDIDFLRDRLRYDIEWVQEEMSWQLIEAPEPVL